jgi:tetratricopeptide (TPR) repeat protein
MRLTAFIFSALFFIQLQAQTIQEGLQALDYDKYEQARNTFKQITEREPANGMAYYYLGQAYINLFKPELARESFTKGVNAEPNNPANYAGLGQLLLDEGKVAEAKQQFDKALSFSRTKDGRNKDVNAIRFVADAMVSAENNKLTDDAVALIQAGMEVNKKTYDFYIVAGDVYIEKNDGGKSASSYEKAIDLEPNNPKAYVKVSNIWLKVRNAEATKTELDKALKINPNYAPALKTLSRYYYLTRKFADAKAAYAKYLENSEPSLANKQSFARILFLSKEYKDALSLINEILAADNSDIYMYRLAGYSNYEVGNETKDTTYYRQGLKMMNEFMKRIEPSKILSNDYEYYGKLYSRLPGNDSIATYYIEKALETDPNKVELYKEAAAIYQKLKKFDKAIASMETYIVRAAKLTPADYYLLGLNSYYGTKYAKADSAFARVNELKPDYADAYYWRGNCNSAMDPDYKDTLAKVNYERYVALVESQPDKYKKNLITSYEYLGSYAVQKDDNATAKAYYNKILSLDPQNTRVKDILKQLK